MQSTHTLLLCACKVHAEIRIWLAKSVSLNSNKTKNREQTKIPQNITLILAEVQLERKHQ